jgi:hypothetical protein
MKLTPETPEVRAKRIAALITDTITAGVIRKGERAGRDYVTSLATEYGAGELTYRVEPWDADARRTNQHRTEGVAEDFAEPFYVAFARAASDMAGGYRLAYEHSAEATAEWDRA